MDLKNKKQTSRWSLQSTSDPKNKWVFQIDPVPFTIGRDKDCNLTLKSKGVSRHHAQLNVSGNMLWIHDSGSTNGTFLNGKPITESMTLTIGDNLRIGQVGFCVLGMDESHLPDEDAGDDNKTVFLDIPDPLPEQLDSYTAPFKKMIHDRAVMPHFQPILTLSDQGIKGYEILGRLPRGVDLPPNPADLFEIAVLLDMESELSSLFREVGVNHGQRLPESSILFVNTHPIELIKIRNLKKSLRKIRKAAASSTIVLEINEKAITDLKRLKSLQTELKNLDIGLAYDDFGVGQTRLIELAKFPPDFLKFDISLIRKIHLAPKRLHQLIVTFLNMSQDLGATTIAEGVECKEEGETCRQLGFDYAQGNFYGVPMPISQFGLPEQISSAN
ncbi:EAL domain/GGDEF domain protein [Olavius sp. associated proteobacterium Delta 1]|nr:EAL domain/GGDEF domain protein [Olavius sp. associated proteobacterium Delta 1]